MTELDVPVLPGTDLDGAEERIEACIARETLRMTLKGTLASYPGCVHWHLKRGGLRGTLEVTLWPSGRRLWLSIQSGRRGEWIDEAAARLRQALENALQE